MGLKVKGVKPTEVNLANIAKRSSAGARSALIRGAIEVRNLSRKYAPRLHTGDQYENSESGLSKRDDPNDDQTGLGVLEKSINITVERDDSRSGRHTFNVAVDEDMPSPDSKGNMTKKVGDYATIMHETSYNLGPVSEEKGGRAEGVGEKYLERAFLELEDSIKADVAANIGKGIGK